MRCLGLANTLAEKGAVCTFLARENGLGELASLLKTAGHNVALLPDLSSVLNVDQGQVLAHACWLPHGWEMDAELCLSVLPEGLTVDWLVVDHYALDARWQNIMRKVALRVFVIDDLADREHDCDILLDQNLYADMGLRYIGKVPSHCKLLLGPGYALLRNEFRQLRKQVRPRTGPVKRVLVFFGGVDADNCTGRAIAALASIGLEGIQVDVVIGAQHPHREEIELACARHQFAFYVQTNRMADLMAAADLAVGAGGTATWERCCLGLPALTVSIADNQTNIAKSIDLFGAGQYVGSQHSASVSVVRQALQVLLQDNQKVASLSNMAYSLVDGLGVDRVCEALRC